MEVNGYEISPGAFLIGVDFFRANLARADLQGADLVDANFGWADLEGANLSGAKADGADFTGANLSGANLDGASLAGADLSGATADEETAWSEGFDPEAAGVIFECALTVKARPAGRHKATPDAATPSQSTSAASSKLAV